MSQLKVDLYKESKKNRKSEVAKKKRGRFFRRFFATLILVGMFSWLCWSVYDYFIKTDGEDAKVEATEVDFSTYEDYIEGLNADFSED